MEEFIKAKEKYAVYTRAILDAKPVGCSNPAYAKAHESLRRALLDLDAKYIEYTRGYI